MTPSTECLLRSERYFLQAAESYRDAGQPGIAAQCLRMADSMRAKALAAEPDLIPLLAEVTR